MSAPASARGTIAWLREQGALLIADRRGINGPDSGWAAMAAPEGNQRCVLRSEAERWAASAHHPAHRLTIPTRSENSNAPDARAMTTS